jgi:hypothetical protein
MSQEGQETYDFICTEMSKNSKKYYIKNIIKHPNVLEWVKKHELYDISNEHLCIWVTETFGKQFPMAFNEQTKFLNESLQLYKQCDLLFFDKITGTEKDFLYYDMVVYEITSALNQANTIDNTNIALIIESYSRAPIGHISIVCNGLVIYKETIWSLPHNLNISYPGSPNVFSQSFIVIDENTTHELSISYRELYVEISRRNALYLYSFILKWFEDKDSVIMSYDGTTGLYNKSDLYLC